MALKIEKLKKIVEIFFENLEMVVVDEVHTYRGVLGSHMAQIFRRLHRICEAYGSQPGFVLSSATIANPALNQMDLAAKRRVSVVMYRCTTA